MSRASRGVLWSFIERFSTQGISLVVGIVIARLVTPAAYGQVAIIQTFISFGQIFIDGGFGSALIQKQDRTDDDFQTVFIFNSIISIVLYWSLFFVAPAIADFYDNADLVLLMWVVGLNLIISGLALVQRIMLTIDLNFKTLAKASIVATVISGIAGIVMAYSGFEVWALVAQQLLSQIIQVLMLVVGVRWKIRFRFSWESFRTMFSFGFKLSLYDVVTNIYFNIINLLIGKRYSATSLGYYDRAFILPQIPSANISAVVNRTVYPLLCEMQDDRVGLLETYNRYLHYCNYIILPLMTLIMALAEPLIAVLLTAKWLPAAEYVSLFSVNFMAYAWILLARSVLAGLGRSDVILKSIFVTRGVSFLLLVITIGLGIKTICIGIVLGTFVELFIYMHNVKRVTGAGFLEQIKPQRDVILPNILMGLFVFFIAELFDGMFLKLVVGGLSGVILYVAFTFFFRLPECRILNQHIVKYISRGW